MKKYLPIALAMAISPFLLSFKAFYNEQEWINWGNKLLNDVYAPSIQDNLQKWEIGLTADHFVRLRKSYPHERQEYFSFKTTRFNDIIYHPGSGDVDTIEMKTLADDIIYQTYNDPKGDLDSMLSSMMIPVKKMPPDRLDSLKEALIFLRDKTQ